MLNQLAQSFLDRILQEQGSRDAFFGQGDFASSALLEHLYRYWLESILYVLEFRGIRREVIYPDQPEGRGRKLACDLVAHLGQAEYWIELKVATENTGYTKSELVSDFEKLSSLLDKSRLYIAVFITRTSDLGQKLHHICNNAQNYNAQIGHSMAIIPTRWADFTDPHIHVYCFQW